jgi:predicted lipoprotein
MKKTIALVTGAFLLTAVGCKKDDDSNNTSVDFNTLKKEVLTDFTNKVAVAGYKDLDEASVNLYNSLQTLNNDPSEVNLQSARQSWKDMRGLWEQCEGFLFGPVEDNDYDPNMDTWPTDHVQLDSLLNSNNPLTLADIQSATLSLRGYHPLEYILFGTDGNRTAASLTARQKTYMISLAEDLKGTCHDLYLSWTVAPTLFANQVINAGNGSDKYAKQQEVFIALCDGLAGICEEVGGGKMKEPFDAQDPAIVESPYSGNSLTDFKNNIIGLQNVYLGKYKEDGKGLNDLVAAKNKALDNKIQNQIGAAIGSFGNITVPFEQAIISQRVQVQQTMTALGTLQTTLETELKPFIIQYITD